jgi:hypothetical protein
MNAASDSLNGLYDVVCGGWWWSKEERWTEGVVKSGYSEGGQVAAQFELRDDLGCKFSMQMKTSVQSLGEHPQKHPNWHRMLRHQHEQIGLRKNDSSP